MTPYSHPDYYERLFHKSFKPRKIQDGVWELAEYYVILQTALYPEGVPKWIICRGISDIPDELTPDFMKDHEQYYSMRSAFMTIRHHYTMLWLEVNVIENRG